MEKRKNIEIFKEFLSHFFLVGFLLIIFLELILLGVEIFYPNKFLPHTSIANINLGGKTKREVKDLLHQRLEKFNNGIEFRSEDFSKTIKPADLGIQIDLNTTITQAFNFSQDSFLRKLFILFFGFNKELKYSINSERLINVLAQELPSYPFQNLSLEFSEGEELRIVKGKSGKSLNKRRLIVELKKHILNISSEPIELPFNKTYSQIESDELEGAKRDARKIIAEPIFLNFEDKSWEVGPESLKNWIIFIAKDKQDEKLTRLDYLKKENFDLNNFILDNLGVDWAGENFDKELGVSFDREKVGKFLAKVALEINKKPINVKLAVGEDGLEAIRPSEKGRELLIERNYENINQEVLRGVRQIQLLVREIGAEVTKDNIDELGIKEIIGQGTSNFAGSSKNRRHNIKIGAEKLNGFLIKPGEIFSLAESIGEVNAESGYLPELVIKEQKTIPEFGGGLCQIATTIFRAAMNSGLPVIERQSHSYPVSYYNPQGTDATIYIPHPDVRFINNTPAYILIQTEVKGNNLTFKFYGTSDGRKVEFKGPIYWDRKPDGSFKAKWTQVVTMPDGQIKEKTFYSFYESPAKYH